MTIGCNTLLLYILHYKLLFVLNLLILYKTIITVYPNCYFFFIFKIYFIIILHRITGEKYIKMRYYKAKKLIFVSENSKTLL